MSKRREYSPVERYNPHSRLIDGMFSRDIFESPADEILETDRVYSGDELAETIHQVFENYFSREESGKIYTQVSGYEPVKGSDLERIWNSLSSGFSWSEENELVEEIRECFK